MAASSFVPMLIVLAAASVAIVHSTPTCSSQCDLGISADQSCYCDSQCSVKNDCCLDYDSFCAQHPSITVGSCVGNCYGVSLQNTAQGVADGLCYCDPISTVYGDSCHDYVNVCSDVPPPPTQQLSGSCEGHCGAYDHPDGNSNVAYCFCDNFCEHNGDCCPDKHDVCKGTCDGFCGGTGSDGSCYCDNVCQSANDCCADYSQFCHSSTLNKTQVTCQNHCNQCNDGCCCDYVCEYLGDCCADKATFCTTEGNVNPYCQNGNECLGNAATYPIVIPSDSKFPIYYEASTIGYTSNNTFGEDECHDQNSADVFYSYTPPNDMTVKASLCGSTTNFKSALYIVENGATPNTLNYECNNKTDRAGCGADQAEVVALLKKGTSYFFVVDGKGGDNGAYGLTITQEKGDSKTNPVVFGSNDLPFDVEGDSTFYTEQFKGTADDSYGCDFSGTNDVFYLFESQENATLSIELCADFASTLIVGQLNPGGGIQVLPTPVCLNESTSITECQIGFSTISQPVLSNVDYLIIVKGFNVKNVPTSGKYRLIISNSIGDSIFNPIPIPSLEPSYTTSRVIGDFVDSFTPPSSCAKGNAAISPSPDIVFKYTPSDDVDVTLSTCGSEFDTLLSVVTFDSNLKKQTNLGCNDDAGIPGCVRGSQYTVHLNGKTDYLFIVDGFDKSIADKLMNFTLNVGQGCSTKSTACVVPYPFPKGNSYQLSGPSQVILNIPPASIQTNSCPKVSGTVKTAGFYRIATGPVGKKMAVSVCPGKTGDPILQVFRETSNGGLTLIKCDHGTTTTCKGGSSISFEADALQSYLIVVLTTSSDLDFTLNFVDNGDLTKTCKVMQDGNQIGDLCGSIGANGQCYCDNYAAMPGLGNACDDYNTVCANSNSKATCSATDCGHQSSSGSCLCSSYCTIFNNCCQDYKKACPTDPKPHSDGSSFDKPIFIPGLPFGYASETSVPSVVTLPSTTCNINNGTQIKQKIFQLNTANVRYGVTVKLCGNSVAAAVHVVAFNNVNKKTGVIDLTEKSLCVGSLNRYGCSTNGGINVPLEHDFEYYFVVLTKENQGSSSFYLEIDVDYKSLISSPPPPSPSPPPAPLPPGQHASPGSPDQHNGNNGPHGSSPNPGKKGGKSSNGAAIALGIIIPLVVIGCLVGFAVYYRSSNPREWASFVNRFKGGSKGNFQPLDDYQEFDEYDSHPKGVGL